TIPEYFEGHWVEITGADGVVKGVWEIAEGSISDRAVTLESNAESGTASVEPGDQWRGVYRFDAVHVEGRSRVTTEDPVVVADVRYDDGVLLGDVSASSVTIGGNIEAETLRTTDLRVITGGALSHPAGLESGLQLEVSGTLTIDAGGSIDVSGKGYAPDQTHPSESVQAGYDRGGSHMGRGGGRYSDRPSGPTYGSVTRPRELGGGGDRFRGGGRVEIDAGSLVIHGSILADGGGDRASGAGGSVWIRAEEIHGDGVIGASGPLTIDYGAGGGGAVAIEYTTAASGTWRENLASEGAGSSSTAYRNSAAGTIFVRDASAEYGDLRIDNSGINSSNSTVLPSLGAGTAQTGSTGSALVTDRAKTIPEYFEGHWVEITGADGVVKGVWEIAEGSISDRAVTLESNAGSGTASVEPGDQWQGVYRFDAVKIEGASALSPDPVLSTTPVQLTNASFTNGNLAAPQVDASLIAIDSQPTGTTIIGSAGAVSDDDQPLTVTATNSRTAEQFTTTAASHGSFSLPVSGIAGDTFTIYATDTHTWPLSSPAVSVPGSIVETNSLSSLTLTESSVAGGTSTTATVTLQYAALHDIGVALSSSDPSIASTPSSIIVPTGSSSAQFTITTTEPASATDVTVTAQFVTIASATLTVEAAPQTELTSVRFERTEAWPGETLAGVVQLNGAAPAGGAVVTLTSTNDVVASVPSSVAVNEGLTYEIFSLSAGTPSVDELVTLSGSYGSTVTSDVTVRVCSPMPAITPSALSPLASTWFDDAAPAGATESGTGGVWTTDQAESGTSSLHFAAAAGLREYAIAAAPEGLATVDGDVVAFHALVNPCNPPREIVLTWSDGTNELVTNWGEDLITTTAEKHVVGPIPRSGAWERLEISAAELGLAGITASGLSIEVYDGEVWFDLMGIDTCVTDPAAPFALPHDEIWLDESSGVETGTGLWSTTHVVSGLTALELTAADVTTEHVFDSLDPVTLLSGDSLVVWILPDECDPPTTLLLDVYAGTWDHAVYWGEDLITTTTPPLSRGSIPEWDEWTRVTIPVDDLGVAGQTLSGLAIRTLEGRVTIDRVSVERGAQ
ncbi:MAG: hypothetical protein KY459_13395, partial [Acidobacteria bacterium]|nr:hypothetical protein [Acidobacteriota bacterium]